VAAALSQSSPVQVGPPHADSLGAVVHLVQEVMGEGAALGWSGVPTSVQATAWWEDLLAETAAGRAAVCAAYDDGHLVGLGEWRRYELAPQVQNADLEKVFVSRRARGGGIGRLLMEDLVEQARAAGVETLTLQCRGNNHGAIRLYQRLGFREYGRLPDFVAAGQDRWDKVLMAIDLRTGDEALNRYGSQPVGEGSST
jgi:ribosomal protein S18 acetylase RimI-like enzyme